VKKLSLPLALICGLLAASVVYFYMKEQEAKALGPPPPRVPVVVARADIPANARLTSDMVTVQQVLEETKHPQAVQSLSEVLEKLTLSPVVKGEQLLTPKVGDRPKATTLAGVIPAGKRAISVSASEVVGVGGLIQPSDWVDILAVFQDKERDKTTDFSAFAVENVEVLAVAREVNGIDKDAGAPIDPTMGKKAASSVSSSTSTTTVTVAVTPEEAQRLMLADRTGSLRLALRTPADREKIETIVYIENRTFVQVKVQ
jgi:pilus assembly protein CpaB